jgi:phosphoglycerol transferase MdoB-like AlkP superfamily enzyme
MKTRMLMDGVEQKHKAASLFWGSQKRLLKLLALALFLFALARLALLWRFGQNLQGYEKDIVWAFMVGARYDLLVIAYMFLPILLSSWFYWVKGEAWELPIRRFQYYYATFILSVAMLVLLIDQEYYTYFQSHLNVFVFAFFEDDTVNILRSIWSDHSPGLFLGIWLLLTLGLRQLLRVWFGRPALLAWHLSKGVMLLCFLLWHALYFVALRGSFTEFPLLIDDASISDNTFVNYLTPNGFFTFKEAFKERNDLFEPKPSVWKLYGFANKKEALEALGHEDLHKKTPTNDFLAAHPPNVVFVIMESMGTDYLRMHSQQCNTLGCLADLLPEMYVFLNTTSAQNGTIPTVEELLLNSPLHPITQSRHRRTSFESSVAYPFKQKGYLTGFLTSGKLAWQNLEEFLPYQYFDFQVGRSLLRKRYPQAEENDWGVYDEFLFDYTLEKLQEAPEKPKFFFLLTTTNHTPFRLPSTYDPLPVSIPDSIRRVMLTEPDMAQRSFYNYQYAAHQLGLFLKRLKESEAGKRTIVVITGDHNNLMVIPYDDSRLMAKRSVPIMFYIPEAYRPKHAVDVRVPASHKDIFATIFPLALADADYWSLGENLFDTTRTVHFFALNAGTTVFDRDKAVVDIRQQKTVYLHRQPTGKWQAGEPTAEHERLRRRALAYEALWHDFFNSRF